MLYSTIIKVITLYQYTAFQVFFLLPLVFQEKTMTTVKSTLLLFTLLSTVAGNAALADNSDGAAFTTWPDTGLTTCYDSAGNILDPCPTKDEPFYGQDAQNQGPSRSYTVLGGGIMVRDNITGLIWERKQNKDDTKDYTNPHDTDNTYTWCNTNSNTNGGSQGSCGTNDTEDFINALNNASFGGYSDWRLPTLKELATLTDYTRYAPAINTTVFPATASYNWSYWTATTNAANAGGAWYINTYYGYDYISGKGGLYHVRAVRGGQ